MVNKQPLPLYRQSKWLQLGVVFFIIYVAASDFFTKGADIILRKKPEQAKILQQGAGRGARCGDKVNFTYSKSLPEISVFLGDSSVAKPMTKSIESMKKGEIKQIEIADNGRISRFNVELTALKPQLPANMLDLHFSDIKIGKGKEAVCGDDVVISIVEYSAQGVAEEREDNIAFSLGAGQVPAGFDAAISNMREGGGRLVTIPPYFTYTTSDNPTLTIDNGDVLTVKIILIAVK